MSYFFVSNRALNAMNEYAGPNAGKVFQDVLDAKKRWDNNEDLQAIFDEK